MNKVCSILAISAFLMSVAACSKKSEQPSVAPDSMSDSVGNFSDNVTNVFDETLASAESLGENSLAKAEEIMDGTEKKAAELVSATGSFVEDAFAETEQLDELKDEAAGILGIEK